MTITRQAAPAEITSIDELEAIIGTPLPSIRDKARPTLHPIDVLWIARSPFCLIATSAADGSCDVSPKGDPAGFVRVLDNTTLAVPERPGNRRIDGFRNILANPHVGLLFVVPGRRDTLRSCGPPTNRTTCRPAPRSRRRCCGRTARSRSSRSTTARPTSSGSTEDAAGARGGDEFCPRLSSTLWTRGMR